MGRVIWLVILPVYTFAISNRSKCSYNITIVDMCDTCGTQRESVLQSDLVSPAQLDGTPVRARTVMIPIIKPVKRTSPTTKGTIKDVLVCKLRFPVCWTSSTMAVYMSMLQVFPAVCLVSKRGRSYYALVIPVKASLEEKGGGTEREDPFVYGLQRSGKRR